MAEANIFGKQKNKSKNTFGKEKGCKDIFGRTITQKRDEVTKEQKKETSNTSAQIQQKDPLVGLNEDQLAAATIKMGRNLVIASAGTGKTSTIMGRVSYLLTHGVKPSEILLLTFTSKAAKEMSERIEIYFGKKVSVELSTGTFHSSSLKLVRKIKPTYVLKLPSDAQLLFKSIFGHRQIPENDEVHPLASSTVYENYGMFVNTTSGDSNFSEWLSEKNADQATYSDLYESICSEFEQAKEKEKFYDFNDILLIAKKYYQTNECHFREIIVDEYQDTNTLQSSLLDSMNPESLYCVGDYDQSIYAFNGADIAIIGAFLKQYKGSNISTLRKNYRSSPKILDLAEKVIKINPRLFPKGMEAMIEDRYPAPLFTKTASQQDQAELILKSIRNSGELNETAVIYRSNSSGDVVEALLKENEIPYTRKGGKSFFEAKDVVTVISIFKILHGDTSLPVFLQAFEISGQKPQHLQLFHNALKILGHGNIKIGMLSPDHSCIEKALPDKMENYKLGIINYKKDKSRQRLIGIGISAEVLKHPLSAYEFLSVDNCHFLHLLHNIFKDDRSGMSASDTVDLIAKSELIEYIFREYALRFSRDNEGKVIEKTLQDNMFKMYSKINVLKKIATKKKTIKAFLLEVSRKNDNEDPDEPSVHLLSVHASKGLEFKTVHIIDLVEDTFPNTKLMNNGGGGIEEERRLFYVAVTRSKHNLFLYSPLQMGNKKASISRFIQEGGLG